MIKEIKYAPGRDGGEGASRACECAPLHIAAHDLKPGFGSEDGAGDGEGRPCIVRGEAIEGERIFKIISFAKISPGSDFWRKNFLYKSVPLLNQGPTWGRSSRLA